jgi:hypothetical protein
LKREKRDTPGRTIAHDPRVSAAAFRRYSTYSTHTLCITTWCVHIVCVEYCTYSDTSFLPLVFSLTFFFISFRFSWQLMIFHQRLLFLCNHLAAGRISPNVKYANIQNKKKGEPCLDIFESCMHYTLRTSASTQDDPHPTTHKRLVVC